MATFRKVKKPTMVIEFEDEAPVVSDDKKENQILYNNKKSDELQAKKVIFLVLDSQFNFSELFN